ncbi:glycerol kinase GlpK [Tuwongella immobilis]|uniref:glycerol kinase n=1 Tax=Tuwongella immobilis TaxID=692036 RepID=A0A6C2YJ26_9BACT|nr:glycerol kinase GlpK [Tuwongella immobilis]VIP01550.1 glycerol kinase : Glycerol kinase OS=Thermobacillus composti (strain DSM 18247 / JCM 13945 / KWC4) GN=glpK PE=3 SV=1: FGGY_N: FGGY_C [Tuwongella immobilis]VTR98741.1 glycerol kinase : Glycerol kinase OS=Thermobacillus composti (strain DSM 18247 / JCM 13945 / KWC4) GN=glpK PE=3 SV=1: FGGY_N: FGGY_C [Tuwongella immobilis]
MMPYVLAIDQGTTSTRAILFDARGAVVASAAQELTQYFPQPGWVEHDAEEIWAATASVVAGTLARANCSPQQIASIGVTNQRETVVIWERATGRPVGRAIVWQDRRTTEFCRRHAADQPWIRERTGLVLDPYFSATKLQWRLSQDPALLPLAERGEIVAGTIDSYLIARLTGSVSHVTDYTNASRTMLLDLRRLEWDPELAAFFGVPLAMLPKCLPSAADFGVTHGLSFLPDGITISGVAGDQQAALFGQGAFTAGEAKCTYGTGAFFLVHTGSRAIVSQNQLISTVAAMTDSTPQYALEGSVFVAGSAVQWLRDGLRIISEASATEELAAQSNPQEPVIFVPGFVGLGAPYWVPEARGAIFGLTRGTQPADLARAALEGVAFQVADLIDAASHDLNATPLDLRVDGGMANNRWFLQAQSDLLGLPVRPALCAESTALGAAFLAGLRVGVWKNLDELRAQLGQSQQFSPAMSPSDRQRRLRTWRRAVRAVMVFAKETESDSSLIDDGN